MNQVTRLWRKPFTLIVVITTLLAISVGFVGAPVVSAHTKSTGGCQLNSAKGAIHHVISNPVNHCIFLKPVASAKCKVIIRI